MQFIANPNTPQRDMISKEETTEQQLEQRKNKALNLLTHPITLIIAVILAILLLLYVAIQQLRIGNDPIAIARELGYECVRLIK